MKGELKLKLDNKKLLLLMAEKQLTYKAIADMSGLSKGTLTKLSKGNCNHITIGKLAKALDVPVTELIED